LVGGSNIKTAFLLGKRYLAKKSGGREAKSEWVGEKGGVTVSRPRVARFSSPFNERERET
jgi:hypothetical protein